MCAINEGVCLLILIAAAVKDIRKREISVSMLVAAGVGSVLYQCAMRQMNWKLIIGGVLVGIMFLIFSRVSGEGIGYGDSLAILVLGIYIGFWNILTVLCTSFFLLLCVMIPVLWKKRMSRKYTLPFLPFLAGGYFLLLLMGGTVK